MSSLIDYDELECTFCGHTSLLPDGDFDVVCQNCGAHYSLCEEEEEDDDDDDDEL